MSVDHYENFPVASLLCPPALRPAVAAIYGYARTADDLADEGDAVPATRLADLAAYRADLLAVADGRAPSPRWAHVHGPLGAAIARHRLPTRPLLDLLGAFEQDVTQHRYADRAQLLDYCRRSANPVGRLLLHLYGIRDEAALAASDAICSALQLANFWQDLGVDAARGRIYAPLDDLARFGVAPGALLARRDGAAVRALVADEVHWTRALMLRGAPLVHAVPGRAGWELRLVVQGGLRVLERIERAGCATLSARPKLGWRDAAPDRLARRRDAAPARRLRRTPRMTPEQYVQQKAAASGSSFYYAFLFLPPPRRAAITAFYAFCREVDDVVDEVSDPGVGAATLAWWRREVAASFAGKPSHPAMRALVPHAADYAIGAGHLLAVIDGCEMDLTQSRYLDYAGLARYCHLVAGVVGEVASNIFGRRSESTLAYAHRLGLAMQLTNIVRDVGDDARRGRIYLPMDELRRFDVKAQELLERRYSDRFVALMRFQAERAERTYDEAFALLADEDRKAQKPGLMMANIYRSLLREIAADGFQVLHQRTSLTPLRKLWIAMKTNWRGR